MAKSTIMAALFALFLFSSIITKKTLEESINDQEPGLKVSFNVVPFIEIQRVCQDIVILDFKIWYEAYIPKYLQKHSSVPAFDLKDNLKTGVETHVKQLKEYIRLLEGQSEGMNNYPPLFLDIKIRKLIEDVNTILHKKEVDPNPFATVEEQEKLKASHGHYIPDLIQDFNGKQLDTDLINALGGSFKKDWEKRYLNPNDPISQKVEELAEPLRRSLKSIIAAFTDPTGFVYNTLGENKGNIIQFYTEFKYLLEPEERTKLITQGLVPTSPVIVGKPFGFLVPAIFNNLNEKPHSFTDLINRDRFLTLNDPDTDLETIHDASEPFFFSSDFNNVLLSDPKDLGLNIPTTQGFIEQPEQRIKRKKANLDRLLYQVYVLARADRTILSTEPLNNQQILQTLKDWVEKTDAFNEDLPIISEMEPLNEEDIEHAPEISKKSDPKNRFQQLIPSPVFKRFYVPLLRHICDKIIGCDFNKMTDEPAFIKKYEEFGNFEDMNKDKALADLIPTEILEKIHDLLANKKIDELDKDLDKYFDDFEPFDEQEIQDLDGQEFSGSVDSPRVTPKRREYAEIPDELIEIPEEIHIEEDAEPSLVKKQSLIGDVEPSLIEKKSIQKLQDDGVVVQNPVITELKRVKSRAKRAKVSAVPDVEKINPLLNKFIPPNKPVGDKEIKIIDKLMDKAETSEMPEKKATINTLLLKFIIQRIQEKEKANESPKDEMTIIDHVNKRLVDKLLGSFSFLDTKGIRNFFDKERNAVGNMRFDSDNGLDNKFFKFDMIFFYFFAAEAKAARAKSEGKSETELKKELMDVLRASQAVNQRFELGLTKPSDIRSKLKSIVYNNVALLERIPAYEFFVNFLDFFNYFENIKAGSDAEYANYSTVFMNFYKFLVRARITISYKIENPHIFALKHLERCLVYTEDVVVTSLDMVDEVCVFSHRKYAEMYYFYKLYLINTNKIEGLTLAPYNGRSFDTHARLFINFALQNSDYSSKLTEICEVETQPICVTWVLFENIIGYLHDRTEASDSIIPAFKKYYSTENKAVKFAIIAALESVYMNVANGNMINWNRYQTMIFDLKKKGIDVTKFDQGDLELLTSYYTRTYKKLIFTQNEENVSYIVRRILNSISVNKLDAFMHFIPQFKSYYHFDAAKFFLLLSQTTEEFRTIAEATIKFNQGHNLFELNNIKNHRDLIVFINQVSKVSSDNNVVMEEIKSFIDEDYKKTQGRSRMCVESEFNSNGMEEDEEAMLNALMEEMASNGSAAEEKTEDLIQEELRKPSNEPHLIIEEQIIQIKVSEDESRIAKLWGLNLDKENIIHVRQGEIIPNLGEIIQAGIMMNNEKVTLEKHQQAMELKSVIKEALKEESIEDEVNSPTNTHSAMLNTEVETNQQNKKYIRKPTKKEKRDQRKGNQLI